MPGLFTRIRIQYTELTEQVRKLVDCQVLLFTLDKLNLTDLTGGSTSEEKIRKGASRINNTSKYTSRPAYISRSTTCFV